MFKRRPSRVRVPEGHHREGSEDGLREALKREQNVPIVAKIEAAGKMVWWRVTLALSVRREPQLSRASRKDPLT